MTHPLIALWAHPRAMSTATERVMRERGDCRVFHEPFLPDYYLHRAVRALPMLEPDPAMPTAYADIRAMLLAAAEAGPVFFKDMAFYVMPAILSDPAFARRLTHLFLIRDPRRSIASYWKLDPGVTRVEIGLEAQWDLLVFLRDEVGLRPLVVEAEEVARDTPGTMARMWRHMGLPPRPEALSWQTEAVPDDWKTVEGWHASVLSSTGIRRDVQDAGEVFEAAAAEAPHLRDLLAHHQPFYEKLCALAQVG